jgi:3-oxoacyl-[acyl-carrier protein] reductase
LVREVTEVWGGIDILVTNIGGPPTGSFDEISNEQWLQAFQGVWLSATDAIRASLPGMRKQKWGRVILVTSMVAKEPFEGLTISNGLRSGLLGLAKSISNEVAADGVTINSILPGYIRTERLNELGVNEAETSGEIPAGRLGEPSELASLAAYLASEQASYITGQAIGCDGGRVRGA